MANGEARCELRRRRAVPSSPLFFDINPVTDRALTESKAKIALDSWRLGWGMLCFISMDLDNSQRQKVADWIDEGLKLADIQKRLETEFGLRLTYLDVRLLVDDLKLKPKDPPQPKQTPPLLAKKEEEPLPHSASKVRVTVDQLARPGAVVSGKVKFSDGKSAEWVLDQAGRLGIYPADKGYKPPAADVQEFQIALQQELQKLGL